ncbi:PKD domain-containing protein [Adhaeribacter radiodurans]|uniref:Right-handed parallel beta-helix repeat-containing protein n=1 Tax=Adhaeribacter radiodurans TaxID=2745197 RepID=A0A7L7L1P8_9BACT|nr:right-handed parallel beta-helix repeat-containing protein [Adhaeribacter radiodurans]QMU26716.1 right-handed parallel beta-helix repeat-containing protein [Adhaeribacter radiodurans]
MSLIKRLPLFLLAATLLLESCETKDKTTNPKPTVITANAGTDQAVNTGQVITLTGSTANNNENNTVTYSWTFLRKPTNSQVTLTGANTVNPSFIPDLPGEYELELTITAGDVTAKDKVLVSVTFAPIVLTDIEAVTVLEDRTPDPNAADYYVNDDINVDADLTIKPGVVIAFAEDALMFVNENAAFVAKGEANKKVKFTGKLANRGHWAGILIYSTNSLNEISQAEVLYAGSEEIISGVRAAITLADRARLTINNTTIAESGANGMFLNEGSLLVAFANNTFKNNAAAPLVTYAANVPKLDATSVFSSNNGKNVIEVQRSIIEGAAEITWPAFNDNTPYRFVEFIGVETGWKLMPGVTIEVADDTYFDISAGYLKAIGTAERKITFTGVTKATGAWNGIIIYPRSANNIMENVQISYAGGDGISGIKAAVTVTHGGSLSIRKSTINNSGGYGIHVNGDDVTVNADVETVNTFTNNTQGKVYYNH